MTSPLQDRIDQAYAELQEQKLAVTEFERKIETAATTVTAKNRGLSVTVDGRGDLVEVKFLTKSYRTMAPTELGQLLVETIGAACTQAREEAASMFQEMLPAGMPLLDAFKGAVDADEMIREAMRTVTEQPDGMSGQGDRTEAAG